MTQSYSLFTDHIDNKYTYSHLISGLGAFGVALQNYPAVELFVKSLLLPTNLLSKSLIKAIALSAGGLCSGLVNFWMNVKLLDGFIERMTSDKDYQYKQLTAWQQIQYFGGISIFVVTGILFGLMAFTFALEGPLAMLSIAAGIFVTGIMTIQEVETWLSSYDKKESANEEPLTNIQQFGKWCGHLLAVGNVLALSFLFTLSLAQSLIMLQVAAFPALMIGALIAFTFGAFTEYYFYNVYLADFCKNFSKKCSEMMNDPHAWLGLFCISTNAFVNGALTYSGAELLTALLVAAHIGLPPVAALTVMVSALALFAGTASFILGMDFWISSKPAPKSQVDKVNQISIGKNPCSLFAVNQEWCIENSHIYKSEYSV